MSRFGIWRRIWETKRHIPGRRLNEICLNLRFSPVWMITILPAPYTARTPIKHISILVSYMLPKQTPPQPYMKFRKSTSTSYHITDRRSATLRTDTLRSSCHLRIWFAWSRSMMFLSVFFFSVFSKVNFLRIGESVLITVPFLTPCLFISIGEAPKNFTTTIPTNMEGFWGNLMTWSGYRSYLAHQEPGTAERERIELTQQYVSFKSNTFKLLFLDLQGRFQA